MFNLSSSFKRGTNSFRSENRKQNSLKRVLYSLLFLILVLSKSTFLLAQPAPSSSMILEFDTDKGAAGTTVNLPLGGTVNVSVNWGDGSATEFFTTAGDKPHTYSLSGVYTVTITGQASSGPSLTLYGSNAAAVTGTNPKLIKVT